MAEDNGKIIWDNLIKAGYTEIATAGIMGNLMAESNFNPRIINGGEEVDIPPNAGTEISGPAFGIAQWYFYSRRNRLVELANSKGRQPSDLMVQIDFLILEMDQDGLKSIMNGQTSPYEAALKFHEDFERSEDDAEAASRRGKYAEQIYAAKGIGCSDLSYNGDSTTYQFGGTSLVGTIAGAICAANSAPRSTKVPHGKHADTLYKNPSKTYCEPVYPDLIALDTKIPEVKSQEIFSQCKEKELIQGNNLIYTMPSGVLSKYGAAEYLNQQALDLQLEQQRKETFDPKKNSTSFKMPSNGKPINNQDPFPYDSKIEELENHKPRCKIESIKACPEAASTAKAVMQLSTNVEKRIVKLENNVSTILRNLARLSTRVSINCIYWGGTTQSEKYLGIRCMKDNRIDDGQYMSLDQCLNCTRYEPLIGQTYDILNDEGINLSQILDDCQMSYTSMDDYCKFVMPTQHQNSLSTTSLDSANRSKRDSNEKDFVDEWPAGLKMDWMLYPVEDQKPHINKAQNINGDEFKKLDSWQGTATNYGAMYTGGPDNKIVANKKMMDEIISKSE